MQYFSKLMKDDPQWNVKLYSENEFENVIKVVRGEKWQFYMCCILPLFSPAKLGGESYQEESDKGPLPSSTNANFYANIVYYKCPSCAPWHYIDFFSPENNRIQIVPTN